MPAAEERVAPVAAMVRCAIYTRTSSEEGLSQDFNSLEAQRECGEAYIRSQRQAGWMLLPESYDDGGFTGANLERPALERLLAHMRAGAIDCVVLYKVDRLSRSLFDFARLMQIFAEHGVSFVSVTQQLNSSTPMGRLTLHVLLSFAEFEREIISERTRDKKGAARRKGKWMGGYPVLGYDVEPGSNRLRVNAAEAEQVREIFARFVRSGSLAGTLAEIEQREWKTKSWTTRQGKERGGRAFDGPTLVRLLRNVGYRGKVQHQGKVYRGEQAAVVGEEVWQQAQAALRKRQRDSARVQLRTSTKDGKACEKISPPGQSVVRQSPTPEREETLLPLPVRLPRVTRLLALAVRMEELLRQATVKDQTELARLGGVTPARVSQIMNLRRLAPIIQEQILFLPAAASTQGIWNERTLRRVAQCVDWNQQMQLWEEVKTAWNRERGGK